MRGHTGHMPDGMGMDRYHERQNMREAASDQPPFKFDVVAVDPETGQHMFVTESTYTEEEAEEARRQCANVDRGSAEVQYKVVERDD